MVKIKEKEKEKLPEENFEFESEPLRNDKASGWSRAGDAEHYAEPL
jgi:hypothetical protein